MRQLISTSGPMSLSGALPYVLAALTLPLAGFAMVNQVWDSLAEAKANEAQNAYWSVTGTPCPQQTVTAFAANPVQPRHQFEFNGARFADAFGEADCRAYGNARSSYRKCMFTSPGVVRVRSGPAEGFFNPGVGNPATVSVEDGKISCVLASRILGPVGPESDVSGPTDRGWLPR